MEKSTQTTYQEQKIQYSNYIDTLNRIQNVTILSEKCIDQALLGQKRDQFLQYLHSLENFTSLSILPLRDSVFNCSALSACSISCYPPSEIMLQE